MELNPMFKGVVVIPENVRDKKQSTIIFKKKTNQLKKMFKFLKENPHSWFYHVKDRSRGEKKTKKTKGWQNINKMIRENSPQMKDPELQAEKVHSAYKWETAAPQPPAPNPHTQAHMRGEKYSGKKVSVVREQSTHRGSRCSCSGFCVRLGIKPTALNMLGKYSSSELQFQTFKH